MYCAPQSSVCVYLRILHNTCLYYTLYRKVFIALDVLAGHQRFVAIISRIIVSAQNHSYVLNQQFYCIIMLDYNIITT